MKQTKLIPPFVMLAATAAVAVVTYLRDFPFGNWLILVFGVMLLFLFIGEVLRQIIEYFVGANERKELAEKEAREAELSAQEGNTKEEENPISDLPPDQ
ncbi:MAG: hypothetical protein K6G16_04615 [Lachnospiraceae bacterium]|nr:hypothetical protein [Lachnospiraceae bacterium]